MMDFKGKVVIITGASSGIGMALAKEFANLEARIVIGARNEEKLAELASEIISSGGQAEYVVCDVTCEDDCKHLVDVAVNTYGKVDVLICNAGISMRAIFDDVELDVLHKLMDVNFWGTVNCVKHALSFIQKSHGSIVGVSSVAGIHGLPGRTGYSASKFAMTGFLETIRIENLKKHVHVMITSPGFTASNVRLSALTANGSNQGESPRDEAKMMSAEQVAHIIAKGVYRRKRTQLMEFNGRATMFLKKFAPAFLDKMFYNHMAKEPDSPFK